MIRIHGLCKSYGTHEVLRDIDLAVERGEAVALIGPSGGGKSTLLRCINGLEPFERGEVVVAGTALHSIDHVRPSKEEREAIRKIRLEVGMVFQQYNLFPHMTVLANIVESPASVLGWSRDVAEAFAMELLTKVNLAHKATSYPEKLSGGEQQRVAIARALAMKPKAMLFDEPTSSLDPEVVGDVLAVIRDLIRDGMTTLIAAHEMSFAREMADRVVVLDGGEIVEIGPPEEIFSNPKAERTRAFLSRILRP